MMKIWLTLLSMITLSSISFAEVQSQELITAKTFNESSAHIGDIKESILTQAEFQSFYGSCWTAMMGQNIAGSDFATLTGVSTLPNAVGRFLRTTGGDSPALMQTQDDDNQSHDHGISMVTFNLSSTYLPGGGDCCGDGLGALSWGGNPYTTTTVNSNQFAPNDHLGAISQEGGNEFRPKNIGINRFIKIDEDCN